MQKFTTATGPAAALMRANIDTDVIIRIERSSYATREEMGRFAFESLRFKVDGTEDPDFILNRPEYRGSPILIAGENFGCGSSREAAVWAIAGLGIRCVLAPSFSGIFQANCFQNGLLPVSVDGAALRRIVAETGTGPTPQSTTVDLVRQVVITPGGENIAFTIDGYRRRALLEGLDDIGMTLTHKTEIGAWQARDRAARRWAWEPLE